MIKNVSEFKEYIFSRDVASLGLLGGTPGAHAAARAKAKAKAQGVPTAAEKRRDAFKHAFKTVYKRAVRSHDDGVGLVEAAFGDDAPAAETPAAVNLEQELSDVIDEDEGLLIVSDGIVGSRLGRQVYFCDAIPEIEGDSGSDTELEDDRRWLVCVKCAQRRLVPRGQFCTFQKGEVRFLCKFVQVICRLTKCRRLA